MNVTKKVIFEVDYNDFDKAINDFLKSKGVKKCDFEIVAHHELCNDVSKSFNVGKYDWAKLDEDRKQEILDGDLSHVAGDVLEWMHEDGLIEAGEYLVNISW